MQINMDSPALSLYALPVLYATVIFPHFYKLGLVMVNLRDHPNVQPREQVDLCKKKGIPDKTIRMMNRLEGAHNNGNEGFPLWAASIIAANVTGVAPRTVNTVAGGLIIARVFYNTIYIHNDKNEVVAAARSLTWVGTIGSCFWLLIQAANCVADTYVYIK